jgi:hypothetical protein
LLSWFDIAYLILDILIISYCFKSYFSSKRRLFQLFGLAFSFLTVSEFLWAFTFIPWLDSLLSLYAYIRLGLYTIFTLLVLRALQPLDKKPEAPNDQNA